MGASKGTHEKVLELLGDIKGEKVLDCGAGKGSFTEQLVNTLILDEPSNHLDLEALSAIEKSIKNYDGTVVIVSHDRYLIENIDLESIYEVSENGLNRIDYQEYLSGFDFE